MTGAFLRGDALGFADLDDLVVPEAAADLFRTAGISVDHVEPNYIRLKPGTGAIVGYEITGTTPGGERLTVPGYARTFSDDRAPKTAAKWSQRATATPLGPGVALLPSGRSVVFVFPNDHRLRDLPTVADPESLGVLLGGVEGLRNGSPEIAALTPVRYKPQRRFIEVADLTLDADPARSLSVFLRLFEDGRGERIAEVARVLRAQAGKSHFPEPLGTTLEGRLYVEAAVQGDDLLAAILDGRAEPGAIADILQRLHACRVPLAPRYGLERLLSTVSSSVAAIAAVDEELGELARTAAARLEDAVPGDDADDALIHGDVALHNFLYSADGPVIVDFERTAMGHPLMDLGQLLAHLREVGGQIPAVRSRLDAFADGLIEAFEAEAWDVRETVPFFTASSLLNRAVGAVFRRGLENWWPSRAAELLRLAAGELERATAKSTFFGDLDGTPTGPGWLVFYPQREGPWPGFVEDDSGDFVSGVFEAGADAFRAVQPEDDEALPSLERWMRVGELIKYRVGRRATIRLTGDDGNPVAYVTVLRPWKARKELRRLEAAHDVIGAIPGAPPLPPLLDHNADEGWIMLESLPGRSLHDLLWEGSGGEVTALERTAGVLARFHSIPAADLGLPVLRPPMAPRQYAAIASKHVPARKAAYRGALDEIEALGELVFDDQYVVHGDLHDKNVLLDGDQVNILDLDMLHAGDPVEDVGNLAAHLFLRGLQTGRFYVGPFLDAYRTAGGSVDPSRVWAVGARTLFRLSCTYVFRRRWRALTPALLDQSVEWAHRSKQDDELLDVGGLANEASAASAGPVR